MSLVIAAWGDPWAWSRVRYTGLGKEMESRSSLDLISSAAGASRALIIVQETLLAANRARRDRSGNCISLERRYSDPYTHVTGPEGYSNAIRELQQAVSRLVEREISSLGGRDVRVEIAPGLGQFNYLDEECNGKRVEWRLAPRLDGKVDMFSFYQAIAALHIANEMLGWGGGDIEVHLDLTHGVNYTSTAIYRATLYAARLYSASTAARVRINVYNSEPYTPGASRLRVWRIRRDEITPKKAVSRLYYAYSLEGARTYTKLTDLAALDEQGDRIRQINVEFKEWVNRRDLIQIQKIGGAAGASAFYGLPLLLIQTGYMAAESKAEEALRMAIGYMLGMYPHVSVRREGHLIVEHKRAPMLGPLKALLASLSMASYSSIVWRSMGEPRPARGQAAVPVAVRRLGGVVKWIAGPLRQVVDREVSKLKVALKTGSEAGRDVGIEGLVREASVKCARGDNVELRIGPDDRCVDVDRRILVAHSGFNKELVEVVCVGSEPGVKYRDKAVGCVIKSAVGLGGDLRSMLEEG